MNVAMPHGTTHGWGIAGNYLAAEIGKLPPVPGVTLHCVAGHHFAPSDESQWGRINIGYCFFEHEILAYRFIPEAARRWDHIVAGSSWCEYHLRIGGMKHTSTILQGVDPALFHPVPCRPDDGRFIVFSGGKFEFRKGQDLVMAAMRVFMARHKEVWLACAWHNHWPNSIKTMAQSRLIDFRYSDLPCDHLYRELLAANGIDPERVIVYPVLENEQMRTAYAESDLGVFPNRCEGGNNMVMCEYMACGRPVIASTMTGHGDVVSDAHALCLTHYTPQLALTEGQPTGVWFEAEVDEIVELLEASFRDRQALHRIGAAAGAAMERLTWPGAARNFHGLALTLGGTAGSTADRPSPQSAHAAELFEAGRYEDAERVMRDQLGIAPLDPDLHNNLATVLDRLGRYREAVPHYEKALALRPGFWEARFNLGNTLKRLGHAREAIKQLEQVVAAEPGYLSAWQNLALIHFELGNHQAATECLQQVLAHDPGCRKSRIDLGDILVEAGRYEEAVLHFDVVLADTPDDLGVLNSKGAALQALDQLDAAEACYRRILELEPTNDLALNNLGTVLRSRGLPLQAIACFNQALAQSPGDNQLIFNRSLARLAIGDFQRGWKDYESRFTSREPVMLHHPELPRWNGEDLAGRRLLVQSEQGYGDTLQFVRYLPLLKGFGPIVFEAQDQSIKSAVECFDGIAMVARGEGLPPVDCQVPLLSLPGVFGTDFSSIPAPDGYLSPDPIRKVEWEEFLGPPDGRLRIGVVWGGRKPRLNANRSMELGDLLPLFDLPDMRWISLQVGPDRAQLTDLHVPMEDVADRLYTFADTAALISCLDLVITIDSAVAHLAGALGRRAWVMVRLAPDWRWYLGRDDSPWYTSIRLFRQKAYGNWRTVVENVCKELILVR